MRLSSAKISPSTVTEPDSYTLTYMVDGEVYKTYEVKYRDPIVAEKEPVKEDYTFSGWSEIPETMPAKDVTVTGTFTLTGLNDAAGQRPQIVRIYSVGGKPLKALQKGVNIVVLSDGTKSKIVLR